MAKRALPLALILIGLCTGLSAQTPLGDYTGHRVEGKSVTVEADSAGVRFMFYRPDILRVDFLSTLDATFDSSFSVIRDTSESVNFVVNETDSTLEISSFDLSILCRKTPLRISYFDAAGMCLLTEPAAGGFAATAFERSASFVLKKNEHFYGTGERGGTLDLRGRSFTTSNTQNYGYREAPATMNINVPFFTSTNGYALYFENTYPARIDFGLAHPEQFQYKVSSGELSYFLIAAPGIPEQLEKYTWLTGRQPLPPRWAFGFIQSRFGYENETQARAVVATIRENQIPCDAIVLDLYWFKYMGDISWNLADWPDPFQMMADFRDQGFKTVVITEPYVVERSSNFYAGVINGYYGKDQQGETYRLDNWWSCGCDAALIDFSNPEAQQWWWQKHPPFFGDELAGIWTDLGEPERHPADMQHFLGPAAKVHNIYNLLWAKTIFEGHSDLRPNQRLFHLTRSGYAGIQRYGVVTWSGDVSRSFDGLAGQTRLMLNMGLSGLAYHNSDIGGFCCGFTTPELYTRWMQLGTFSPITRAHGSEQPTEPWAYGEEALRISKIYLELRYRLLPYNYTLAFQNYQSGMPLARPLFFEDPGDPLLYNESDSYLWGDALLISPVVKTGQTSKSVYLPEGEWIDLWTDQPYRGGQTMTVPAPLETMPIFVKSGSIIPMQPVMNYTNERQLDTLKLVIYPSGEKEARFTLYEDDGETLSYQSGAFAQTRFHQTISLHNANPALVLDIDATQGTYQGKLANRVYLSEIHNINGQPVAVTKNGRTVPEKSSLAELRTGQDGYFYDPGKRRLFVHTPASTDSSYRLMAEGVELATEVAAAEPATPADFRLAQNFPNPFNPSTTIRYETAHAAQVTLKVYDVRGREVVTLVDRQVAAGRHEVQFDGNSTDEKTVASGLYFYRLSVAPLGGASGPVYSETRKMIFLK